MAVINKLKRKMITTVLIIQAIVFAIILVSLNVTIYKTGLNQTSKFMTLFASKEPEQINKRFTPQIENEGRFQSKTKGTNENKKINNFFFRQFLESVVTPSANRRPSRNIFSVQINTSDMSFQILSYFPLRYTSEEVNSLIDSVIDSENIISPKYVYDVGGTFLYIKTQTPKSILITFYDYTKEIQFAFRLGTISICIYLFALLLSSVVAWFVAERSVKPVKDAFETQKQFVADAGHELKTPLAVVSANVDALSGEIGENKWVGYIKTELKRMDSLVTDLLYLAKNDAGKAPLTLATVDLSRLVYATILPFESMVFEQGRKLEIDIQDDIQCTCDQRRIAQVVAILMDNALKNSFKDGLIKVSLSLENGKRKSDFVPVIKVYNEGEGLDKDEIQKVFKRFYRGDSSRTRETGGSGLGLSIAEAIICSHNGKITIESEKGSWISFSVYLNGAASDDR